MKRHPPIHPSSVHPSPLLLLSQTRAWLSCDPMIRPPTQHTRALRTNTHIYTLFFPSHTCTLPSLPPVTYVAWLDKYTITHGTRSRGGSRVLWKTPPPPSPPIPPHCCRSVNEQLQSVGKNHPCWHLGTKAGTWESGANVASASLMTLLTRLI